MLLFLAGYINSLLAINWSYKNTSSNKMTFMLKFNNGTFAITELTDPLTETIYNIKNVFFSIAYDHSTGKIALSDGRPTILNLHPGEMLQLEIEYYNEDNYTHPNNSVNNDTEYGNDFVWQPLLHNTTSSTTALTETIEPNASKYCLNNLWAYIRSFLP